jgi:hypothetical protein
VAHDLGASDKTKRDVDARTLLQTLRNDKSQNFSHTMTGYERWFSYNYDSPTIFARARDEVGSRVTPTIRSKKVMVTIFVTVNQLLKHIY